MDFHEQITVWAQGKAARVPLLSGAEHGPILVRQLPRTVDSRARGVAEADEDDRFTMSAFVSEPLGALDDSEGHATFATLAEAIDHTNDSLMHWIDALDSEGSND